MKKVIKMFIKFNILKICSMNFKKYIQPIFKQQARRDWTRGNKPSAGSGNG